MGGMVPVFNPGRVPALLDNEGRTLGAGQWGEADPGDPQTAHALAQGIIIQVQQRSSAEAPAAEVEAQAEAPAEKADPSATKGAK